MLMLLAELSAIASRSDSSWKDCLTSRWQSSNVPRTAKLRTLSPQQVNCRACVGETLPEGNSNTTRNPGRRWKAAATAPPVSPDVATNIVSGRESRRGIRARQAARNRAPKSLNAAVGP
jgi:hypothetical protein